MAAQARTNTGQFAPAAKGSHVILIICDDRNDGFILNEGHFQASLQRGLSLRNVKLQGFWPIAEAPMMVRSALHDLTVIPEAE